MLSEILPLKYKLEFRRCSFCGEISKISDGWHLCIDDLNGFINQVQKPNPLLAVLLKEKDNL